MESESGSVEGKHTSTNVHRTAYVHITAGPVNDLGFSTWQRDNQFSHYHS